MEGGGGDVTVYVKGFDRKSEDEGEGGKGRRGKKRVTLERHGDHAHVGGGVSEVDATPTVARTVGDEGQFA